MRCKHVVPLLLKDLANKVPNYHFFFHHKYGFRTPVHSRNLGPSLLRLNCLIDLWQVNLERRALAHLAIDPYVAVALLDYAVDGGQAQSRSLAQFLGGEERLE